jgi:ParB-like chromosome segregation protein Spo0J
MSAGALSIKSWPIDKPVPYVRNARVCPESAIAKVAGSIREFGFKNPILVDGEGTIIAGHTRLLAAQRLELPEVPVIVCADLSPAKVKALRLADNRTAAETSWEAYTGKAATLEGDGRSFADATAERLP